MELKPGYKQTEVGVIPEDWQIKRFKDIFTLKSGFAFSSLYFSDKGPIVLTPGNFKLEGGLYFDERNTKRYSGNYSSKMLFNYGDLLLVMTDLTPDCNLLGKPAFVHSREKILHNQRIGKVELQNNYISIRFLYWFFLSNIHAKRMKETATGSTVRHTSNRSIYNSLVALPPAKAEQEAIAEALSDTDALIKSLEQLITKKRHIKQGAMQELLTGKKRLYGFANEVAEYKQTEVGVIPQDWEVVSMAQVAECLVGLTYSPIDVRDFGILVLRSSNIQNGRLAFDDNVFVDMEVPTRAITQENDILICVRNGSRQLIGKCALIDEKTAGSAFGAFMSVLRSDSAKFLFFQFQSKILKHQIDEVMGATINQITNKDMAAFKVIWPPSKTERNAIATVLSDMDEEIATLEAKRDKARQIKQGMMQELLTGRIRLV